MYNPRFVCHGQGVIRLGQGAENGKHSIGSIEMARAKREKIKLESTAGTGFFYTTTKNKGLNAKKMEISKYDPKARKHVKFVEKKV